MTAAPAEPREALTALAEALRAEPTVIADHVVAPDREPVLGMLAASGPRAEADPGAYALVVEATYEGYLLHYEEPRVLAGHDEDLALLAGDYLYAVGLDRLATLGDTAAVAILSDLITQCARLQAEGETTPIPKLWRTAAEQIAAPRENRP